MEIYFMSPAFQLFQCSHIKSRKSKFRSFNQRLDVFTRYLSTHTYNTLRMSLTTLFKDYCRQAITERTVPLSAGKKQQIVDELQSSPFKSVVQAWSVLDFQEYKHLVAEGFDTYFGYDNSYITAENILEIVHPEDQEAFGKLYYLCLEGLMNMPIATKGIGHFCISYRMRDAYGKYHKILETNNILECDPATNIPLINLAQISLSSESAKSSRVSYFFKIRDEAGSVDTMQQFFSQYDSKINIFTENELKIARLLKQGLTSHDIAQNIFLSKHTIDKYRKNMLSKTECSNTPKLIAYLEDLDLL